MTSRGRVRELAVMLIQVGCQEEGRYLWHRSQDRYAVFLAEFFLRRSNRSTVSRFLPQFLAEFPDLEALADADPEAVSAVARWAGLRTRTLRLPEIARTLSSKPSWTAEELLALPHVGRYAAEGIALYAFDEPHFPVDNNVRRVVGRFLSVETEDDIGEAVTSLMDAALAYGGLTCLKHAHRGALALGWTSCRASRKCEACPLNTECAGRLERAKKVLAA